MCSPSTCQSCNFRPQSILQRGAPGTEVQTVYYHIASPSHSLLADHGHRQCAICAHDHHAGASPDMHCCQLSPVASAAGLD